MTWLEKTGDEPGLLLRAVSIWGVAGRWRASYHTNTQTARWDSPSLLPPAGGHFYHVILQGRRWVQQQTYKGFGSKVKENINEVPVRGVAELGEGGGSDSGFDKGRYGL